MSGFGRFMSSWKAGDFFRQLATVVIGIVITFGGSSLIQRGAQKREARHLLEMVKIELEQNAGQARARKEWFEYLKNGARALRLYIDNPNAVPIDTLRKYINIQGSPLHPGTTNALEVLRSSDAIRSIKDQSFLVDLFGVYDLMVACDSNEMAYNDEKIRIQGMYDDSVERDMVEEVFEGTDIVRQFALMAASPHIARYLVETAQGGWISTLINQLETLESKLDEMAKTIDAEIN